jgi:hypothetical protein
MTTQKIRRTLLRPDPGQAREQLEELAARLEPGEKTAGQQLRAVAAELVQRGLVVTVVEYQDTTQEVEAVLPHAAEWGPVIVSRDASGTGCQLSWEEWADIADDSGIGRTADIVAAVLHSAVPAGKS